MFKPRSMLSLVIACVIVTSTAAGQTCGDINDDGVLNILDIVRILNHICVSPDETVPGSEVADCDGRSGITVGDAGALSGYLYSLSPMLLDCSASGEYSFPASHDDTIFIPYLSGIADDFDILKFPVLASLQDDVHGFYLPVLADDAALGNFRIENVLSGPDSIFLSGGTFTQYLDVPTDTLILWATLADYKDGVGRREIFEINCNRISAGTCDISLTAVDREGNWRFAILKNGDLCIPEIVYYEAVPDPPIDTAWVSPAALFFTAEVGSDEVLTGHAYLQSSNAPSHYTATVISQEDSGSDSGITLEFADGLFVGLIDTEGETDDSVGVSVWPEGLDVGTYFGMVAYEVEGIADPAYLWIILTVEDSRIPEADSAWLSADTLFFNVKEGEEVALKKSVYLRSTNAPAQYTAFPDTSSTGLIDLIKRDGTTDDSVRVIINAGNLPVGEYMGLVYCIVDGIEGMLYLWVKITVESSSSSPAAWVEPQSAHFILNEGDNLADSICININSSNAPAEYYIDQIGWPQFIGDYSGATNDNVCIQFNTNSITSGIHSDTLLIYVDGVDNSPIRFAITFEVNPSGTVNSAWLSPDSLFFTAQAGDEIPLTGKSYIGSTNEPDIYVAFVDPNSTFISLTDSVGYTGDDVEIMIDAGSLEPGVYYGTVYFQVDGIWGYIDLNVCLTVTDQEPVAVSGLRNQPNPFNPFTDIQFTLSEASLVTLSIYNLLGQKVTTLIHQELPVGNHSVRWDGRSDDGRPSASGIYLYRVEAGEINKTRKMILLR